MSEQLIGAVVTAMRERLQADLEAAVEAINADVTDGPTIQVTPAARILDYIPPPSILTAYPTIGIGDGPSRFEDDIGDSATGVHEVLVVVYEQAADPRDLAWKLRRQQQAVLTTAMADRNLGEAAWGTTLIETAPGPTLVDNPDNPREWMSWTGARMRAKRDEE